MTALETIERRKSVRNFKPDWLADSDLAHIKRAANAIQHGPFGNSARVAVFHPTAEQPDQLNGIGGAIGTYGFIKNARAYVVAAIKPALFALNDFGFILEGVVLEAARLGVGSCWLGGAFRPGPFGKAIAAQDDEFVPAVIALGYPSEKRRVADKLIELHHNKGNRRAKFGTRFFADNDFAIAAVPDPLLQAIHAAPSSCNTQPWRVVKENDERYHFFFERDMKYSRKDKLIGNADLQLIDMGIAMRHLEIAAKETGMKGAWSSLENPRTKNIPAAAEYLVSWSSASY